MSLLLLTLFVTAGLIIQPITPPARAATGVFGFDYWPYNGDNTILGANWSTSNRPIVASDLDQIVSLGGKAIRLMIWPDAGHSCFNSSLPDCSWSLTQSRGGRFTAEFTSETANVSDLIRLAYIRKIKVIVAFANAYLTCGWGDPYCPPGSGQYWWQWAYGSDSCSFLRDASTWINGYVKAIEASPYRSAVIAYDYQNEVSAYYNYGSGGTCGLRNNWDYLKYVYDHTAVPLGKRGVSVLCVICSSRTPNDAQVLHDNLDTTLRTLNFVDFHSYPDHSVNSDLAAAYDLVKSSFPNATVVVGEFGYPAGSTASENKQASTVTDMMRRAQAKGIPYYLHWTLWDGVRASSSQTFGFGYTPDNLKSVFGSVSSLMNAGSTPIQLVSNPDMETVLNGKPARWAVGGTVPASSLTLSAIGPNSADAATNNYYSRARVAPSVSSGYFWLVSSLFKVTPSARLTLNGYIRTNLANARLWVSEYNSSGVLLRQTKAPALPPPNTWSWRSYLHTVGQWGLVLRADTTKATIAFVGQVGCGSSCPSMLDVDAVSAGQS